MKSMNRKAEEEVIRILPEDLKATETLIEKHSIAKEAGTTMEDLALCVKVIRVRQAMSELDLVADGVKEEYRELQEELEKAYKRRFLKLSIPELDNLLERIRDHECMGCDYNCPASCIYDPDAPSGFGKGGNEEPWYPAVCPLYPDVDSILCQLIHRLKIYNIDTDFWKRTEGSSPTAEEVLRDLSNIVRKTERRLVLIGKGPNDPEASPPSESSRELMSRIHKAFDTLEDSFDLVRGHPCCSVCAEDELVHRNRRSSKHLHAHWTLDSLDLAQADNPKATIFFGVTTGGRESQAMTALTQALKSAGLEVDKSKSRWGDIRVSLLSNPKESIRMGK